jgi:hypothetical protein
MGNISMGLLSSSISVTRYRVEGELEKPVIETVTAALKKNSISEIDDHASEITAGWTSFNNPYHLFLAPICFFRFESTRNPSRQK